MYKSYKLINDNQKDLVKKSILNNIVKTILLRNLPGYGVKVVNIIENTSTYQSSYICDLLQQVPFKEQGSYRLKCNQITSLDTTAFNSKDAYDGIIIIQQEEPFNFELQLQVSKGYPSKIEGENKGHVKYSPVQLVHYTEKNDLVFTLLDYVKIERFIDTIISLI